MKKHGIIVADNGSNWYISGAPDPRWSDDTLGKIKSNPGSAFEAVLTVDTQGNPIKPTSVLPETLRRARRSGRPETGCQNCQRTVDLLSGHQHKGNVA